MHIVSFANLSLFFCICFWICKNFHYCIILPGYFFYSFREFWERNRWIIQIKKYILVWTTTTIVLLIGLIQHLNCNIGHISFITFDHQLFFKKLQKWTTIQQYCFTTTSEFQWQHFFGFCYGQRILICHCSSFIVWKS